MNASLRRIPGGRTGLRRKIAVIRKLVYDAKRDPDFREQALAVVRHVPERDWAGEIGAVANFVRSRMRYTRDPYDPRGLELFVDPRLSMRQAQAHRAAGDCDDFVLLASAMLETIGHPTRYRVGGAGPGRYLHIWLDVLDPDRGWVPVELTKKDEPVGWDPSGRFPYVETHRGGLMHLRDYAYDVHGMAGFSKYFKKVKKYLPQFMSFLGPLSAFIPFIGPFISPILTMASGAFAGASGGIFGGGGSIPSSAQSYGNIFRAALTPSVASMMPGAPQVASEDPFGYLRGKVGRYASKFGFRNPFRFLEGLGDLPSAQLGWIPPDLGLSKHQGSTDPKTDHKNMVAWHTELQNKLLKEMARVGAKDHRWRLTKNKETGILEKYPPRPGFAEGGVEAAKHEWGKGIVNIPSFTFWIWTTWIMAKHPIAPPPSGSTYDWGQRVAWINNYTRQIHEALWKLGTAAKSEKEKATAAAKSAKEAAAERKKELARLAKEAEAERKQEEEQRRKELEHQRRMKDLLSQGKIEEAKREAERRRQERSAEVATGRPPRPPLRGPGAPTTPITPPAARAKLGVGMSVALTAGVFLLMAGRRKR